MPKKSNPFIFIALLTISVSLILSLASTQLKTLQNTNIEVDKKRNVLKCLGLDIS